MDFLKLIAINVVVGAIVYMLFIRAKVSDLYILFESIKQKAQTKNLSVKKSEQHAKLFREYENNQYESHNADMVSFQLKYFWKYLLMFFFCLFVLFGVICTIFEIKGTDHGASVVSHIGSLLMMAIISVPRKEKRLNKISDVLDTYDDLTPQDFNEIYDDNDTIPEKFIKNPLYHVAEYNVSRDGKSFSTSHSYKESGYFTWENAMKRCNKIVINNTLWHLPNPNEIRAIIPLYDENRSDLLEERITIRGVTRNYTSDYKISEKGIKYALRFKGHDNEQLCAFRYEWIELSDAGKINYCFKITCRYLGQKEQCALDSIACESFWNNNSDHDITRIFHACGRKLVGRNGVNSFSDDYWTNHDAGNSCAWVFSFHSDGLIQFYYDQSTKNKSCIRLIKSY